VCEQKDKQTMTDAQVYAGAAVMGVAAGMRSMASPAIVSQLAKSGLMPAGVASLGLLYRPATAKTMAVLAVGELIADKLPFMPARTDTPAVVVRAISGGFSGAAICSSKKRSVLTGALLGAFAAVGTTYGAYKLRKWAGERFDIPDPVIAIAEDALVAGCGMLVLSSMRASSETA
jgi:uncharacterized membrane protein